MDGQIMDRPLLMKQLLWRAERVYGDKRAISRTGDREDMVYERLLPEQDGALDFPETTASSMCYTSGTTGDPKGVLYSHRGVVLHTLGLCVHDVGVIDPDEYVQLTDRSKDLIRAAGSGSRRSSSRLVDGSPGGSRGIGVGGAAARARYREEEVNL